MPPPLSTLHALLKTLAQQPDAPLSSRSTDDVDQPAVDQSAARREAQALITLRSNLARADVLGAVRHELRLPLGLDGPVPGQLRLIRADDSSVVVGSRSSIGTEFRAGLIVRDGVGGSLAEYAVDRWHERDGAILGLRQLQRVRRTIVRAVLAVDPEAAATGVPDDEVE